MGMSIHQAMPGPNGTSSLDGTGWNLLSDYKLYIYIKETNNIQTQVRFTISLYYFIYNFPNPLILMSFVVKDM